MKRHPKFEKIKKPSQLNSVKITFFLGLLIAVLILTVITFSNISFNPIVGSFTIFPNKITTNYYGKSVFAKYLISPTPTPTIAPSNKTTSPGVLIPNPNFTLPNLFGLPLPTNLGGSEGMNETINLPEVPEHVTTTLVITQSMIDVFLDIIADDEDLPFKNLSLKLNGNIATLSFDMSSPIEGRLTANATVSMQNSMVVVDIIDGNYAGISLPDFLISPVEKELNKFINQNIAQIPDVEVKDVYITDSKLYVKATLPTSLLTDFFDDF